MPRGRTEAGHCTLSLCSTLHARELQVVPLLPLLSVFVLGRVWCRGRSSVPREDCRLLGSRAAAPPGLWPLEKLSASPRGPRIALQIDLKGVPRNPPPETGLAD